MENKKQKDYWKCVIVDSGVQFVMTHFHLLMPELPAGSLAMKVTDLFSVLLINDLMYFFNKGITFLLSANESFCVGDGHIWLDGVW